MERREFCHFDPNFRNMCGAPPNLILEGLVIQPSGADAARSPCRCAFREGRRVCVPEEGNLQTYLRLCLLSHLLT